MKKLILLVLVLSTFFNAKATHIMGGEITWECIKDGGLNDGMYVFTMKVYRDCDGTSLSTWAQTIEVWDGGTAPFTTITVDFISNTDISPNCDVTNSGNPALDCATNPVGAVEEYIYQSAPISLVGTPPATGWHFTWDSCCRNGATTNLVLSSTTNPSEGFTLRASMFPYYPGGYVGTTPVGPANASNPCFDSSPIFNEGPKTIICTGYPFSYSHNASDPELDSITYAWAEALDDIGWGQAYNPPTNPTPIPYVAGYTFNSPLPGNPTLDSETGEISYNSTTAGNFATVVRVDAYKCGQLVASIYREIQAVLIACPTMANGLSNNPPNIGTPTQPTSTQNWNVTYNSVGLPSYDITVNAGALIDFDITANDSDLYAPGVMQDLTMEITGGQMFPCNNSPCAFFTDMNGNDTITGPMVVSGNFSWQTSCSQIMSDAGCGNTTNVFTFSIKAYDDFCPAVAITIATIKITILPALTQPAPLFKCVTENSAGDISLTWDHHTVANNSTVYYIYGASNISGPYSLIAVENFPSNSFTETVNNLPASGIEYWYMTLESLCANTSASSDTIIPLKYDVNHSNVACWDDTDGRIAIDMITSSLAAFTYYLDSVPNTNAYPLDSVWDNLPAGTYDVTVSDNAYCTITEQIEITAPGYTLQALASDTMNSCYGASLGMAIGYGAGGTPPYAYEWFDASLYNFSSNDTAANLSAGGYLLEVTDANGCDTFTTVTVIEPQTPLSGSPQIFGVACKGDSTGMIIGNAQGSWAPYTYLWYDASNNLIQSTSSIATRDTLQNVPAGTYALEVYDAQDCFVSYTLTVGEPATALKVDSVSVIATNACYGDADGEAIFYASGGMPSYVYEWDNGSVTTLASGLTTGYHTFSVSDTWGCEVVDSVFIFGNSEIQSSINILDNVSCYGNSDGSVGISSVGGIPNYAYHWSVNGATTYATPSGMANLPHGVYYVTTDDILGCSVLDSFFISEPMPLSVEASEFSWVSCFGADDGSGIAIAQGGTAPYIFDWGGGLFGDTVYALTPGYHTVTVTDAEGCTATDTILTHEPPLLSMFIDNSLTVLPYCNGVATGSLTGVSSGGTGSHSYAWSEAITGPIFGEFTPTLNNVLQGVYTITVTDDRGCMASATGDIDTITSTMSAFITPLVTYSGGWGVSCFGASDGELEVIAFGGVAPYTYDWLTNSSTTNTAIGFPVGYQSVDVEDTNGCKITTGYNITEPTELAFTTLSSFDGSCLGSCDGVIELSVSGGTSSYDLIGTDNLTGSVITSPIVGGFSSGICSGDYTISVSDANGCSSVLLSGGNDQIVINVPVATSAAIDASSVVDVACNGGSDGAASALNPSSGSLYSYNWKDLSGSVVGTGTSVSGLAAGTYVLYSYYSSYTGCTSSDTVVISEESAITSSSSVVDVDCFGNATGSIAVTAQGGVGPYVYNPAISNGLSAGNHTITVTDANGCIHTHVSSVGSPLALGVIVNRTGFVLTANTPTGGVSPFSYKWFKVGLGQVGTGSVYTVSNPGNYYVVVTDANFCTVTSADETYIDAGVFDLSSSLFLSVYPNPFKDETMVDFGGLVEEGNLRIVDVYGKLIEEHKVLNAKSFIVSRTNKASGIYFMEIETNGVKLFTKIVIE